MIFDPNNVMQLVKYNRLLQRILCRYCFTQRKKTDRDGSVMTIGELKKTLRAKKLAYKEGYTCLTLDCKFCDSISNSADNKKCYFNKKTGFFICPHCDVSHTLDHAWHAFESGKLLKAQDLSYKARYSDRTDIPEEVIKSLGIKTLKQTDLKKLEAEYISNENVLWFPLRNIAGNIVGEKIFNLLNKNEETYQETSSGLLMNDSKGKNKAILVNNVLDYIVLSLQKYENHCVICLPHGLSTIPQECLPALENFKELIFWFKYDSSGWDSAKNYASKLDEKRCLLIRPTDATPCPYEALLKKLNLRFILQNAAPVCHKSITTFSTLKNDILSDLQNIEKVSGVKWKRFPILNKILKGHRKGELTIVTGPTGSGKTTFISEYSLDLALQGVSTLWGSFEIRNVRLASTLLRQFVGYSLENKLSEFNYWCSIFEKFPLYFMTFHGQQQLKVIMEAIEHAHYVYDVNHVIIDNLQFMMGLQSSRIDKYFEQDAIISAFRNFATRKNVHVTLIIHPRKERPEDDLTTSSIFGSAKASQEADNVLIIQDKRLTSVRGKKFLQIVKNRYSGDLGIMPLIFDKDSLCFSSSKPKKTNDQKTENS